MYCAYVTTIKDLRKHSNADRLQCATIFGNNVIVDLSYQAGQRVIYFPVDGQLGEDFAKENNLVRVKDAEGNNTGGYQWRYKSDDAPTYYKPKTAIKKKSVLQFDISGNLIAEHCSVSKAAKSVGLSNPTSIIVSCKSSTRTAAGYIWRYKDSND